MMLGTAGVEMTASADMTGRVRRQAVVSAVALGVIWAMAATEGGVPVAVELPLVAGWALMPPLLAASVRRPRLRYGLVVPAALVAGGLTALCFVALPAGLGAAGWLMVAAGVLMGGGLGSWFWYRLLPVPSALDRPLAPGRWALIAVHVGLVVVGLALVGVARL